MDAPLLSVDRVEILTLQDNYIDLTSRDNSDVVKRAQVARNLEISNSLLAEHGFSALVTLTTGEESRTLLFDFGFSEHGAAFNVDALDLDLSNVGELVLSHGHIDHLGGLAQLVKRIERKPIDLVLHPVAFRHPRYIQAGGVRISFPPLVRERVEAMGINIIESTDPRSLLEGAALFLGEIPRKTTFEHPMRGVFYDDNGESRADGIEDDSAIVAHVRGKGLVVLSGCAHAGIINTVRYAREVTGIEEVYVVMGGLHLAGADPASVIAPTTAALKAFQPRHVIPTHCTGRNASVYIEQEMKGEFLLNMVGTRLVFRA